MATAWCWEKTRKLKSTNALVIGENDIIKEWSQLGYSRKQDNIKKWPQLGNMSE